MFLELIDGESAQDHSVKVRKLQSLSSLRYLTFCNVLHIRMGVSGPSLLMESTDSMINRKISMDITSVGLTSARPN